MRDRSYDPSDALPAYLFSKMMCRENVASHRSPCFKISLTVWEVIHLSPQIWLAVEVTVLNVLGRCINRMYQSWAGVVALGRTRTAAYVVLLINVTGDIF